MTSLSERELEIERTRDRLNGTIDRIQDKLTLSGMVDEVMGSARMPSFDARYQQVLDIVRRNPVPVLVVAAGLGWMLNRVARRERASRANLLDLPVNTGRARVYDPDDPVGRSGSGSLDGRHGAES